MLTHDRISTVVDTFVSSGTTATAQQTSFDDMTKAAQYELAQDPVIEGRTSMNKTRLVSALRS